MLVIIIITVIFTGFVKAVTDRISWSDLFKSFKFFSREFTGVKDKNNNGKVSFFEKWFPLDGWHLGEWLKFLPYLIIISFYVKVNIFHSYLINYSVTLLLLICVHNFSFSVFYDILNIIYGNKKKL